MSVTYEKPLLTFLLVLAVFFLSGSMSYAQRTVYISPGFGTLNNVIYGDTTLTGERIDTNTVYVLQRGGLYILDGSLEVRYPVTIVAADSAGPRPKIIEGVSSGGSSPSQAFRPRANMTLKGLYISCRDELGGLGLRIIRMSENNMRMVLDSCVLDLAGQSAFRIDGSDTKIFMTNSIVSNIGTTDSPDNGRVFDDRGNDIDTLVSENNTFYNITFRALRDAGGIIRYAKFDHTTMVNVGSGAIDLGQSYSSVVTNNIFINCGYYGSRSGEAYDYNVIIDSVLETGVTQTVDISNNNFYNDPAIATTIPDTINPVTPYDSTAQAFLGVQGTGNTDISEALTFTDGPSTPVDVIQQWYADPGAQQPPMDTTNHAAFDFSYPTSATSYTAGIGGKPLGDLNWFSMTTGVKAQASPLPEDFSLFQNYPNPFNPSTIIRYHVSKLSNVELSIYNSLGQLVTTIVNSEQSPGTYSIRWNGTNSFGQKVGSGIYLYRIKAGDLAAAKKMILLK